MDTDERFRTVEDAAPLLTPFGAPDDPRAPHVVDVQSCSGNGDTIIMHDSFSNDDLVRYDPGDGPIKAQVDVPVPLCGTVTFYAGATLSREFGGPDRQWRDDFNHHRPHSSLAGLAPWEHANRSKEGQNLNRADP